MVACFFISNLLEIVCLSIPNILLLQGNSIIMKKYIAISLFAALFLGSCTSYKNVPYMQDIETVNNYGKVIPLYDAKIMPKDLLSITVNTTDPLAAAPFNLTVQTTLTSSLAQNLRTTSTPMLQQYLVNNEGEIDGYASEITDDITESRIKSCYFHHHFGKRVHYRISRSDLI